MGKEIIIVTISLGNDGANGIMMDTRLQLFKQAPIAMAPNMHCQKV